MKRFIHIIVLLCAALIQSCVNTSQNKAEGEAQNTDSLTVQTNKFKKKQDWIHVLDSILKQKNSATYSSNGLTYRSLTFKKSNRFIFDRYDDTYHYSDTERGDKYITANITVSSETKDPLLHGFGLYYMDADSALNLIDMFKYRFFRWEDYGSYLGNYSDNKNDFAYSESIKFAIGVSISDTLLNKKLLVLTREKPFYSRTEARFNTPPVSYVSSTSLLNKITADYEWIENGYIKIAEIKSHTSNTQ